MVEESYLNGELYAGRGFGNELSGLAIHEGKATYRHFQQGISTATPYAPLIAKVALVTLLVAEAAVGTPGFESGTSFNGTGMVTSNCSLTDYSNFPFNLEQTIQQVNLQGSNLHHIQLKISLPWQK